jgi:hypothetical protein
MRLETTAIIPYELSNVFGAYDICLYSKALEPQKFFHIIIE